ncbi:MAG: DUF6714 family protein [Akkermansiaceae bacterium]
MRISSQEARDRGYDPSEITRIKKAEAGYAEALKLRDLIENTFTSIPKPKITLRVARGLDDEWEISPQRLTQLSLEDPESNWREISKAKTECYQEYFTFSDPEGWRFYLPAYMCHYLSEFPDYGYDAVYTACSSRQQIKELTEEELKILDRFLELCNQYESH